MNDIVNSEIINPELNTFLVQRASTTPLEKVDCKAFRERGINFYIKREDTVDPYCSGNKFYKLYHHIEIARQQGVGCLLSFGGAFSNHIHALAAAGQRCNLKTIGVIRGEQGPRPSPTLQDAARWGMTLHYLSRQQYRNKEAPELIAALKEQYGSFYLIPEGGSGVAGALGCRAMGESIRQQLPQADWVCTPCGTGATLAGIAASLPRSMKAVGFSVLKGAGDMNRRISSLLRTLHNPCADWRLYDDFHCGGYARFPADLRTFMSSFEDESGITLDPVYTAKMMWGLFKLMDGDLIPEGTTIVAIHTGGLQGRRGFDLDWKPFHSD